MTTREAKQAQWWWRVRRGGKARFIILRGVLGWGIATAVLGLLLSWLSGSEITTSKLVYNAIAYPIIGIGFGWWLWRYHERKFGAGPTS